MLLILVQILLKTVPLKSINYIKSYSELFATVPLQIFTTKNVFFLLLKSVSDVSTSNVVRCNEKYNLFILPYF